LDFLLVYIIYIIQPSHLIYLHLHINSVYKSQEYTDSTQPSISLHTPTKLPIIIMPEMQHISPESLTTSLPDRIAYLSSFLSLTETDTTALLAAKPLLTPLIPTILDSVYTKLLSYDITAQAFVPRSTSKHPHSPTQPPPTNPPIPTDTDYTGETAQSIQELTATHPQITHRKTFLKNYLIRLVSTSDLTPTSPFWTYLNNVGIMHTGRPGFKHREKRPDLKVDFIHMSALLGFVADLVIAAVVGMEGVDGGVKMGVLRAVNKVLVGL
jgi:Protoglobin